MDKLIIKSINEFTPENYEIFLSNPRIARNHLKLIFIRTKKWGRIINKIDKLLFKIYDSFSKVEETKKGEETISKIIKLKMSKEFQKNQIHEIGTFEGYCPIKPLPRLILFQNPKKLYQSYA